MEGHIRNSPKLGHPIDSYDIQYDTGLSTVLVATIEDAKDRISQIEYIFCSQLYPSFQSKYKSLEKAYSEARKTAEDTWKGKENNLLLQIKKHEHEKHQAVEENRSLKLEKEKSLKELDEKTNLLLAKIKSQELKIEELEKESMHKSKEIDEGMEMQNKLLLLLQSKASVITSKGKQLKDREQKMNVLLAKQNSLKKKVDDLHEELKERTEKVGKGKELRESLLKNIESQASEIIKKDQLLNDRANEKKLLVAKLEHLEQNVGELQNELKRKIEEVSQGRVLQDHLQQEHEKNEKQILAKVKGLEEKGNELLKQREVKSSELEAEKKKSRDVLDAHKRLKSQLTCICTKLGLTGETVYPQNKLEDESGLLRHWQNPKASAVTSDINKNLENKTSFSNNLEGDIGFRSIQSSSFHTPTATKCPVDVKSAPAGGAKRPASSWRDTRSNHNNRGHDPHDDFLESPFENIIKNLNKKSSKEVHDHLNVDDDRSPQKQQHKAVAIPGQRDFKYVEPIRKKSKQDNLKRIECKQCKKFYNAVLPNNGGKATDGIKQDVRCEHHDGVSRHRYRYVPPSTPDGFWNIGFESEM